MKLMNLINKILRKSKPRYLSGTLISIDNIRRSGITITAEGESVPYTKIAEKRVVKKPIEVFKELISEKPVLDLSNLNEKEKIVKERIEHLKAVGIKPQDELVALEFIRARKKYSKFSEKFKWAVTTDAMINKLLDSYELKRGSVSSFYKTMPTEAVLELKQFLVLFEKVSGLEPETCLIVDDGGEETKKDPILLAKSPFGNWWYILGAWDKEVEIVDELVYNNRG